MGEWGKRKDGQAYKKKKPTNTNIGSTNESSNHKISHKTKSMKNNFKNKFSNSGVTHTILETIADDAGAGHTIETEIKSIKTDPESQNKKGHIITLTNNKTVLVYNTTHEYDQDMELRADDIIKNHPERLIDYLGEYLNSSHDEFEYKLKDDFDFREMAMQEVDMKSNNEMRQALKIPQNKEEHAAIDKLTEVELEDSILKDFDERLNNKIGDTIDETRHDPIKYLIKDRGSEYENDVKGFMKTYKDVIYTHKLKNDLIDNSLDLSGNRREVEVVEVDLSGTEQEGNTGVIIYH